jgi:hypothetical protein
MCAFAYSTAARVLRMCACFFFMVCGNRSVTCLTCFMRMQICNTYWTQRKMHMISGIAVQPWCWWTHMHMHMHMHMRTRGYTHTHTLTRTYAHAHMWIIFLSQYSFNLSAYAYTHTIAYAFTCVCPYTRSALAWMQFYARHTRAWCHSMCGYYDYIHAWTHGS